MSLKIVGHGVVGVHGAGDVTLVITSDSSVCRRACRRRAAALPVSGSMTRKTGERARRGRRRRTRRRPTTSDASATNAS